MTYFAHGSIGERYARFRPDFHALAVAEIERQVGFVDTALDVACGTGQSTRALAEIASKVVGIDASKEMLTHARPHERVEFRVGAAERLPFAEDSFELVATSLAFHWFDQATFLREARRMLRPGGCLAIYNDAFTGTMVDDPLYEAWNRQVYLSRFPTPARNVLEAKACDWRDLANLYHADLPHEIISSQENWVGYLTTQSNVIAALERGAQLDETWRWLAAQTASFFENGPRRLLFRCSLDLYRPDAG